MFLRILPPAFLVLVSCVAYVNAGHKAFLFDDAKDVLTNPSYDPTLAAAFQRFWRERSTSDAPLTYLTFAVNHAFNRAIGIHRADLTGFLVVNVLIHAINACLVYFLVRALLARLSPAPSDAVWIPLATAVLFAVHPMHASSVAYVIQRRGSLAAMFYLLAVLAYLRARGLPPQRWGRGSAWPWTRIAAAVAVPVCYWLSISAKSTGLTLPLVLLVIELCLQLRTHRLRLRHVPWIVASLGVAVVGLFAFLWRHGLFDPTRLTIKPFGDNADWGPWAHFLTESRVFVHYWKLLLLPLPRWSCIDHGFQVSRSLLDHYAIIAVALHGALLALGVLAALKRYTLAAIGIAFFYIALIPYVLLPQAELMVEYKTYLASVGLALIVAEGLSRLNGRVPMKWQVPVVAVAGALLLGTTLERNRIYQSPIALWSDAVAKSPDVARPHYNLADALVEANRPAEALAHYAEAMRLAPGIPHIANNFGIALLKLKRPDEAARQFEEAIRLDPGHARAHNNLGTALYELGRPQEAVQQYREALRLQPDNTQARYNLASTLVELADALSRQGKTDEAIARYREAATTMPGDAAIRFRLGNALAQMGRLDDAIRSYKEAVRLKPDYAEALTNLGNTQVLKGQDFQALQSFQNAVKTNPRLVAAHSGLAYVLEKQGRVGEAIAQYEQVLQIDPNHARARAALDALISAQTRPTKP